MYCAFCALFGTFANDSISSEQIKPIVSYKNSGGNVKS